MAATGVKVDDAVVSQFNEFKLKKLAATFILYKIADGKIVTDYVGPAGISYDEFITHLPANEPRYAVYDCDYKTKDGRDGNKLVFIAWAPETASVKNKMVYAGSKDALTTALVGIMVKLTATDMAEASYNAVIDQVLRV